MNLVLRTRAIKITNRGGGQYKGRKDSGSDYAVFICPNPRCGHRNKHCMYEHEAYMPIYEDRIPFKCTMCRMIIELERPYESKLLVSPADFSAEMAQRRKALGVDRTVMGRP